MNIRLIKREDQVDGGFNNGAVLEKRPIIYNGGTNTHPYSNLFYWAHAWSEKGSTIGLHPHQGFEIMSFVLTGSIEHYDTKLREWEKLKAGDVQIIRSGNGISHSEKINPNSSIFQIWFDPNMQQSLSKPATYDDYESSTFPVMSNDGIERKIYKGEGAPVQMNAEGIEISEWRIKQDNHSVTLDAKKIYSCFLLEGNLQVGDVTMNKEDFIAISGTNAVKISATQLSKLFVIASPLKPSYQTYFEREG